MTNQQQAFIKLSGSRDSQWEPAVYTPELGDRTPINVMRRKGSNQRVVRGGAKGTHRAVVDVIMPNGQLSEVFRELTA